MQDLISIPVAGGDLTLPASEVRAVRRNVRAAKQPRTDALDYGVIFIFYDPMPDPGGEIETLQIWFTDEKIRDSYYDGVRELMQNVKPEGEQ